VVIDLYRRNLQRAHVTLLAGMLSANGESDRSAVARQELTTLRSHIRRRMAAADSVAQAHLQAVMADIARAFDPSNRSAPAPVTTSFPFPRPADPEPGPEQNVPDEQ
jgi:hypothetical protein